MQDSLLFVDFVQVIKVLKYKLHTIQKLVVRKTKNKLNLSTLSTKTFVETQSDK